MNSRLMSSLKLGAAVFVTANMLGLAPAHADEIKIGLLSQYSGTYSWWGQEYDRGVGLYLDEHGGKIDGHTITIVKRDEGGSSPQRARQLAQELVVRDKVQYLIGGAFTPTIMGTADIVNETKTPYIMGNSGTSSVTDKSPYFVRAGFTQWQLNIPLTQWAYEQGARKAVIVAADFAPGHDAIDAYTAGFIKAFYARGLAKQGVALMATNETQESDLPAIGDGAIGMVTAQHYSPYLDNPANKDFVAKYKAKYGALPSLASLAVYDGMHLIEKMIKATGGKKDGDKAIAAVKGYSWESPRGPATIDPKTREITQNVYMRRIEKVDGVLGNVPFKTYTAVVEPWHAQRAASAK